jgi:hypothetical protein
MNLVVQNKLLQSFPVILNYLLGVQSSESPLIIFTIN